MSSYPLPQRRYSIQEYIEILESSEEKYEFFDGKIVRRGNMAEATRAHSRIATNASRELDNKFIAKGKRCGPLDSDALLAIPALRRYRFPDITVQCDDTIYDEQFKTAGTNPTLVIEIVSDSSRLDDYGPKLVQYGLIESLRDYVVIEQAAAVVVVFSRAGSDDEWRARPYTKLDQVVRFPFGRHRGPHGRTLPRYRLGRRRGRVRAGGGPTDRGAADQGRPDVDGARGGDGWVAYLYGMTAPAQAYAKTRYTVEEYFDLLDSSDEKWEFFDGEVYAWEAMAGTTDPHSAISVNVIQ